MYRTEEEILLAREKTLANRREYKKRILNELRLTEEGRKKITEMNRAKYNRRKNKDSFKEMRSRAREKHKDKINENARVWSKKTGAYYKKNWKEYWQCALLLELINKKIIEINPNFYKEQINKQKRVIEKKVRIRKIYSEDEVSKRKKQICEAVKRYNEKHPEKRKEYLSRPKVKEEIKQRN